jgi:hypothetical protein
LNGSVKESRRNGNGWGIVVVSLDGQPTTVQAYVACLANAPGATVQEIADRGIIASGGNAGVVATCPTGALPVGGGFANNGISLVSFDPTSDGTRWSGGWLNTTSADTQVTIAAECLTASGAHLVTPYPHQTGIIPVAGVVHLDVACPSSSFASGGGFDRDPTYPGHLLIFNPNPTNSRLWNAYVGSTGGTAGFEVYATCLSFS